MQSAARVPAPPSPAPVPAQTPQQAGLWERPATPVATPVGAPVATPRPAEPVKAPDVSKQSATPAMPVEDAYKLLNATAGSAWESIEQTRRQLVQQSHPLHLKSMSAERRSQVLAEAKRANAAYLTLSRARCSAR